MIRAPCWARRVVWLCPRGVSWSRVPTMSDAQLEADAAVEEEAREEPVSDPGPGAEAEAAKKAEKKAEKKLSLIHI